MRFVVSIASVGFAASLAAVVSSQSTLSPGTTVPSATESRSAQSSVEPTLPANPVPSPPTGKKKPKERSSSITYPQARKGDVVDNYFGTQVADPYRWLEALKSDETQKFLKDQNRLADQYFDQLNVNVTLEAMFATDYSNTTIIPKLIGSYYYYYMRTTPSGQKSLYRNANKQLLQQAFADLIKTSELLVDPTMLSPNGISGCLLKPSLNSPDNTKFNCLSQKVETDYGFTTTWDITRAPAVMIDKVLFTHTTTSPAFVDTGYAYARQTPGPAITWENAGSMGELYNDKAFITYFHKYETDGSEDIPCPPAISLSDCATVFAQKTPTLGASTTTALLPRSASNGTRYAIVKVAAQPTMVNLTETPLGQTTSYMRSRGNDTQFEFYETDMVDPIQRHIFSIPLSSNNSEARILTTLSKAKYEIVKQAFALGNGTLAVNSRRVAVDNVQIFDAEGKVLYDHPDINGIMSDYWLDSTSFLYTYEGYTQRPTTYRWDKQSKNMTIFQKSPFDVSEQLLYSLEWATSKDGTKIPMSVVKSKKLKQDGNNPVFTYVYGGFGESPITSWLQQVEMIASKFGGIYGMIHARGDQDFDDAGDMWWRSATTVNKPRTIEDTLAGGQWFVDQKWSSNGRVAVNGHSNGGAMTAAACIQGRELYGACIAEYGIHDTLRQQNFTTNPWFQEYGNSANKTEVDVQLSWAPLVNIKAEVRYPAIYIDTGDHDIRVHPMHSFKLAATLQAASQNVSDARPVILRTHERSGHIPSVDHHTRENWASRLAFWAEHVGATLQR
ncbi:prolyl oligopeptidase family-domain-containing protein [Phlyctochytrium arcticum]|nr:prolyl oligopeptidase family-domain-containing protein [Phlyctochytrium arcticum]